MIKTRSISYSNILSDAANLSYFAGKILNETRILMKTIKNENAHKEMIYQCNLAIKSNYIYNLKMLYPGLRIVCQDAELEKT